jgi:hypothetical protein
MAVRALSWLAIWRAATSDEVQELRREVSALKEVKPTLFCGCDRDTLNHNGRARYTMLAELQCARFHRPAAPGATKRSRLMAC